ncbi:hypothetical protein CDG79_33560 [Nostoc sp. 'Peltigera membranacea cyanobiont' 232]|nr:hypothetical protein CDG79_33560 [Nostoc sp. 'Peltigera membranacea cyanobiont' 232]
MFKKFYCRYQNVLDPPKSPDKLGDFDSGSPLFKGSQRGLLPKGEATPRGLPKWSDWRGLGGDR